jgi:hypothetical protein
MALAGAGDHFGGKIYAHPLSWRDGRQQIAPAAADFQDALAGDDEERIYFRQTAMINAAPAAPTVGEAGDVVPVGDSFGAITGSAGIDRQGQGWDSQRR